MAWVKLPLKWLTLVEVICIPPIARKPKAKIRRLITASVIVNPLSLNSYSSRSGDEIDLLRSFAAAECDAPGCRG